MDKWLRKMCGIYISAIKKEGNLDVCDSMNGPWGIMLREISQIEKDEYCINSFICGI